MRKKEMNKITMTLNVDHLIKEALQEDISSEDVTTNAVMKEAVTGEVQLICKQDGVVAGLDVFHRVFEILDENVKTDFYCKDGDEVKKGCTLHRCQRQEVLRGNADGMVRRIPAASTVQCLQALCESGKKGRQIQRAPTSIFSQPDK